MATIDKLTIGCEKKKKKIEWNYQITDSEMKLQILVELWGIYQSLGVELPTAPKSCTRYQWLVAINKTTCVSHAFCRRAKHTDIHDRQERFKTVVSLIWTVFFNSLFLIYFLKFHFLWSTLISQRDTSLKRCVMIRFHCCLHCYFLILSLKQSAVETDISISKRSICPSYI